MSPENCPKLPEEIVEKTVARHREILGILTGIKLREDQEI